MGIPYAEVIGDPIAHSKSPLIHKFWLEKLGLDYEFRSFLVTAEDLSEYLKERVGDPSWCGASVTIPHKQTITPLLDELTYPASAIGAVNAVVRVGRADPRLVGHNTDAPGFLDTLRSWPGLDRTYRLAKVIGTGGAAAAVAWALRMQGFLIVVYSRSNARAEAFLRRLGEDDMDFIQRLEWLAKPGGTESEHPDSGDIVINASPLGMRGFPPLEINLEGFRKETLFYDLVYDPTDTQLIHDAREHGYHVMGGLDMLIAQAAAAFALFFNEAAPRQHDEELKDLLKS